MPRYLRWIAAISSGIMMLFVYSGIFGAVLVGTGGKKLNSGLGFLATFVGEMVPVIVALGVNDWLRERYGPVPKKQAANAAAPVDREEAPTRQP